MIGKDDTETETAQSLESLFVFLAKGGTAARPVAKVATTSPETDTGADRDRLLLEDIVQRYQRLVTAGEWTDATMQIVENGIDAVLWSDEGASTTREATPNAVLLWNRIFEINSKPLRWQFLSALRHLRSREAVTLEQYVVPTMLKSDSPGDRIAAIKSLWSRDMYRARKQLAKLKESETDPVVLSLITQYLGSAKDGTRIHSAA
jgi:hypothetical protein